MKPHPHIDQHQLQRDQHQAQRRVVGRGADSQRFELSIVAFNHESFSIPSLHANQTPPNARLVL